MTTRESISIFNRATGRMEQERVLGEGLIRFLYEQRYGRFLANRIFKQRFFSRLYGIFQDLPLSSRKIVKVAHELEIDLTEAEKPASDYPTFNAFFSRALKEGARPIDPDPAILVSPCDARLLVFRDIREENPIHVKGGCFCLKTLLDSKELASRFSGGDLFLYRLCPADYHRFHFPDNSVPGFHRELDGPLHSVNPIALASGFPILDHNLRHLTLLNTESAKGEIAMIEIGALCVGSIVQTYVPNVPILRGDEKGMFLFGGSSLIVIYEPEKVKIDEDLVEHSAAGIETLVKLGMPIGTFHR
ncbi:MAG: phosphatidylserine decarboxylase [Planctomycetota bacterium]